ncbi:MAG TPA: Hpt domain-containing protein, partial [Turneriella sp.]|nr:Hpt domain-containing protein [Turneriella sp.]
MSFNRAAVDSELLKEFFIGCEEHLSEAESAFIDLEKHPSDIDIINDIFRHFHSVKGDAAAIGVDAVRILAHELETMLDKLREQTVTTTPELLDILLEGLTLLQSQVLAIQENKPLPDIDGILTKLSSYTAHEKSGDTMQSAPTSAALDDMLVEETNSAAQ